MNTAVRMLLGVGCAIALATPISAATDPSLGGGPTPSAIVVRTQGGIAPSDEWFSFEIDGSARRAGAVDEHFGHYRARVNFSRVASIITEAGLCTRPNTFVRPAQMGSDMISYSVDVRCGNHWRTSIVSDSLVARAVHALRNLADALDWEAASEVAPPDGGIRGATSTQP